MTLKERYNRLTPAQKREFQRMQRPSMLTDWKQLTDEQIITMLEKDAKKKDSSEFASIASRPKVLSKSQWQEILKRKKHPALKRAGVSGFGKPKRTPKHPKKSHVVVVKDGDKVKTIRFGEQGASVAGKPKKGESKRMKAKRKSFKSRHRKNIKRGRTSAAYWANKVKW